MARLELETILSAKISESGLFINTEDHFSIIINNGH